MSLALPSLFIGSLQAAGSSIATKAPGSVARIHDNWNAKSPLRENTIKGEMLTLGQVGVYAALGSVFVDKMFPKLAVNRPLLNLGLAITSNCVSEVVSRLFFNRKIDANNQVVAKGKIVPLPKKKHDDDDDDHLKHSTYSHDKSQYPIAIPVNYTGFSQKCSPFSQAFAKDQAQEVMFAQAQKSSSYPTPYPASPFQAAFLPVAAAVGSAAFRV